MAQSESSSSGILTEHFNIYKSAENAELKLIVHHTSREGEEINEQAHTVVFDLEHGNDLHPFYTPRDAYDGRRKRIPIDCESDFSMFSEKRMKETLSGYIRHYREHLRKLANRKPGYLEELVRQRALFTPKEAREVIDAYDYNPDALPNYIRRKAWEHTGERKRFDKTIAVVKSAIEEFARLTEYLKIDPLEKTAFYGFCITLEKERFTEEFYRQTYRINRQRVCQAMKNLAVLLNIGNDIKWNTLKI